MGLSAAYRISYHEIVEEKKQQVLGSIEEQGMLTDELREKILAAETSALFPACKIPSPDFPEHFPYLRILLSIPQFHCLSVFGKDFGGGNPGGGGRSVSPVPS